MLITGAEKPREGEDYAVMTAYILSILGLCSAFATNLIAVVIASGTMIACGRGTVGYIEGKRIVVKNLLIFALGVLPLAWVAYGLFVIANTPIDDLSWGSLIEGAAVGLAAALAVCVLKVLLIVDFIKYLNKRSA